MLDTLLEQLMMSSLWELAALLFALGYLVLAAHAETMVLAVGNHKLQYLRGVVLAG